jgi:hypothetical protein
MHLHATFPVTPLSASTAAARQFQQPHARVQPTMRPRLARYGDALFFGGASLTANDAWRRGDRLASLQAVLPAPGLQQRHGERFSAPSSVQCCLFQPIY